MSKSTDLPAGESLAVRCDSLVLEIVRDRAGDLGIMDARGAWMPPVGSLTPTWSFVVFEGHEDMSDHGSAADAIRGIEPEDLAKMTTTELLRYLHDLTCIHPLAVCVVILKAWNPSISLRDLGKCLGMRKTHMGEVCKRLERDFPSIARIITAARHNQYEGQRRRRSNTPPRVGTSEPGEASGVFAHRENSREESDEQTGGCHHD